MPPSELVRAALVRAARTVAQTVAGYLAAASVLADVNWTVMASAAGLAGLLSLAMSVAGLPEVDGEAGP